mmetsp:Transcript_64552/g.152115  ORF Transcript_64552/g.152115 Transcript_64552/m.152115 type:complete len:202 (-) Transcript_64552:243-848(-)
MTRRHVDDGRLRFQLACFCIPGTPSSGTWHAGSLPRPPSGRPWRWTEQVSTASQTRSRPDGGATGRKRRPGGLERLGLPASKVKVSAPSSQLHPCCTTSPRPERPPRSPRPRWPRASASPSGLALADASAVTVEHHARTARLSLDAPGHRVTVAIWRGEALLASGSSSSRPQGLPPSSRTPPRPPPPRLGEGHAVGRERVL